MAVIAVIVQLKDGQGVLVRVDLATESVQVDHRNEQHHSWQPVSVLNEIDFVFPKYRVERQ